MSPAALKVVSENTALAAFCVAADCALTVITMSTANSVNTILFLIM